MIRSSERKVPRIVGGIRCAAFVVADISDNRPDAHVVIGVAHGLDKPIVRTARAETGAS